MASPAGEQRRVVPRRGVVASSVRDATYFGMAFIWSANGSPARSGHAAAIPSQVRRPNSSASVLVMTSPIAAPIASGSKYGIDQPPWRNPPSVSSSGAAGGLHDTVEADEVAEDDAHVRSGPMAGDC